jgi:hypothetical protein
MSAHLSSMAAAAVAPQPVDTRVANSYPQPRRFALLAGQLAVLLALFRSFHVERPEFFTLAAIAFGGFAVSYWLPFRWKQPFFIALSLGAGAVLLGPVTLALLLVVGLSLFAVIRSPLSYRLRVAAVVAVGATLAAARATGWLPLPDGFWPVLGAMFMFRMIIYLYDMRHMTGGASWKDYLAYFFLLPNYYFLLFPVVDYQTFGKSYFARDAHLIAQRGIHWMARGALQLLLYRLVYQVQAVVTPERLDIPVAAAVAGRMVLMYLLYLQVSGQFHMIVGMLHLFGYDLPETNRRYLLARSLTDFWRRINIYWKDFMVKVVYFPVYFRWRKKVGEARAQVAATALVFLVTWLLHAYQYFWLKGYFRITWTDTIFWGVLGLLVMANVLVELQPRRRREEAKWIALLRRTAQTAATFSVIVVLWSLWSLSSIEEWWDFVTTAITDAYT